MKMFYRRQTKNLRSFFSGRNLIVTVFAIVVLFFVFDKPSSVIKIFQSASLSVYLLKQDVMNYAADIFSLIISKENLIKENQFLKKQNDILNSNYNVSMESLRQANLELRNNLGRINVATKNRIGSAFVIGKPPVVPYGSVAVDLGSENGIKTGDLALVGDYIIGKISTVFSNRSIVKLHGEKGEVASLLVGDKRLPLNGQGAGFGAFKASVAREAGDGLTGQNVRIVGEPNYIFGSIIGAEQSESAQHKNLFIQSPINIFETAVIDIIRNENAE